MIRSYRFVLLLMALPCLAHAQQPFEEYGYKPKVATLSKGKYVEFFDQDTLVEIGSVVLNTNTGELVYFITYDTAYSEATLQPEVISRWLSPDPLAEEYYSVSPYVYTADNPILFNDPNGAEIFVYHWGKGKNGEEGWQSGHTNADSQKSLEAFAKTKAGYAFLSQYAKAGQKIGSVEFKESGQFADQHLNFREADVNDTWRGKTEIDDSKHQLEINVNINTHHQREDGNERMAITMGHENLLHLDNYDDKLIQEFREGWKTRKWDNFNQAKRDWDRESGPDGDNDHSRYINNQKGWTTLNTMVSQLKAVMNPEAVNAAKQKHDARYIRRLKK